MSEIAIYEDGMVSLEATVEKDTLWLNQKQIANLFDVNVPAVSKHIKNIFDSNELDRIATVSKMEIVQKEGKRSIKRKVSRSHRSCVRIHTIA